MEKVAVQGPGKRRCSRQMEQLSNGKLNLHLFAIVLVPLTTPALSSGLQLEVFKCNLMVDTSRERTHRLGAILELRAWKKQGWD